MKLFAKLLVLLLILAMAGPFFMRGPDGQPLMRLSDVSQKFKQWMGSAPGSSSGAPVELHRWQDENGQWHYSNKAPARGNDENGRQQAEIITVDPNVNVIQATPVPAPKQTEPSAEPQPSKPKADEPPSIFNAVDETNKVKSELEQRNEELLKRLDET